ncbi:MAG: hypothetical protein JXP37_06835 [Coriobacteriia bacterium]|nr:hypothetical protein [Coriobacteriia bacterium]
METALKVLIIMLLGIVVALVLYEVMDAHFTMTLGPDGFGEGFTWLLKMRAATNGGQIAPSLDALSTLQPVAPSSGWLATLTEGMDLRQAPSATFTDLVRLSLAILGAMITEMILSRAIRGFSRS